MPAPPGKKGLNLLVSDALDARLAEVATHHSDVSKNWIAIVLLAYGVRHWRRAMDEYHELVKEFAQDAAGPPVIS